MQARTRHEGREPVHEFQRRHHEVARAVAIRRLQLEHHLPRAVHTQPLVGDGRARLTSLLLSCITNYLAWYLCTRPIYAESVLPQHRRYIKLQTWSRIHAWNFKSSVRLAMLKS